MSNGNAGWALLSFAVACLCLGGRNSAFAGCDGNCPGQAQIDWLIRQQEPYSSGLLPSYEKDDDANAYIFDVALVIIAFTEGGEPNRARDILDTMEMLQIKLGNGSWNECYDANDPNVWVGCWKKVTGPIAWMVIAINFYEDKTGDANYAPVARKALGWMDTMMHADDPNDDRYGSLRYSSADPCIISTEHNIDAYSAYYWRGILDSNDSYLAKADLIRDYLREEMWARSPNSNEPNYLSTSNVFWEGFGNFSFSTDPQSWGVLSLGPIGPDGEEFYKSLCWLWYSPWGNTRTVQDYNDLITAVQGFKSGTGEPNDYVWVDGTEHVAAAFYSIGDDEKGDLFHGEMGRTVDVNGGLVHSFWEYDPNIRWPENYRYNYVASAAWYYFNEVKINPFRPSGEAGCRAANINKEGQVDFKDLRIITGDWLKSGLGYSGDIYEDEVVDFLDFGKLAEYWLCGCAD